MADRVPRSDYPWWVKLSLWGVKGRAGLWAYVALSIARAIACGMISYAWDLRDFSGFLSLLTVLACRLSALVYWLSIRWVDRHGSWKPDS